MTAVLPISTPNLINNPGADANAGAPDDSTVVTPTGWTVQAGEPTAVQYGASSGFPTPTDPGPSDRGANFFAGGNSPCSELVQTIDISSRAADIDAGKVHFVLTGWLGGYSGQTDMASVALSFGPAATGNTTYLIGPVLAADRQDQTGMLMRANGGLVPSGARTATILLQMTRYEGTANDG